MKQIKDYTKRFCTANSVHLRDLDQGSYNIIAAKKQATRFGNSYKLLVETQEGLNIIWSNKYITDAIKSIPKGLLQQILDSDSGFLTLYTKPHAVLMITGRGTNQYRHATVYCDFKFSQVSKETKLEEVNLSQSLKLKSAKNSCLVPCKMNPTQSR